MSTAVIILVVKTTICFKNTLVYEVILKYLNFKLDKVRLIQLLNHLLLSIREVNFKATKDAFVLHTLL